MEKLAIIKHVQFGETDNGIALHFTCYDSESTCFDAYLKEWEQIQQVLMDAGVSHVDGLNGKPCWVELNLGTGKFKRMMKI